MRLDASTALPVSANRRRLYECCPPSPTFTAGNAKTQVFESKHVINRELWVALQFPIGDDVSAYYPLRSSVALCIQHDEGKTEMSDDYRRRSTMQIESRCFIMQG
jgi:hypothetical protein